MLWPAPRRINRPAPTARGRPAVAHARLVPVWLTNSRSGPVWSLWSGDVAADPVEAQPSLTAFVKANVATGATVLTDGWQGYAPLRGMGYRHRPCTQGDPRRASTILPHVHRVFGNLQTWLRGTHHGVSSKRLQAYLDEYTFRFNRRRTPMAAFQTLLGLGGQQSATTYKQLCAVESTG